MHLALLVLALAAVDQPMTPTPNPPDQQVERVRAALEKPHSKITVSAVCADFSVHIEVRRPLQDIFDKPVWQLPPIGWGAAPGGCHPFRRRAPGENNSVGVRRGGG